MNVNTEQLAHPQQGHEQPQDQAQVQHQLQFMYQHLAYLQAQLQAQQAQPKLRINQPDLFYGDKAKVEAFLFQHQLHFDVNKVLGDASKIIIAAASFRGPALDFWIQTQDAIHNNNHEPIATWQDFCKILRQRFEVVDPTLQARDELAALTQSGDINAYINQFTAISNKILSLNEVSTRRS